MEVEYRQWRRKKNIDDGSDAGKAISGQATLQA
jgi:hypothetical protein